MITDSTLREGQQALRPFTVNEALAIYEVLNKINGSGDVIRSTELFLYTNRDREIVKAVKDSGFKYPKPVAWIRAAKADVDLVVEAGLEEAVMLCSISDIHIRYKLGLTRKDVEKKYLEALEYAPARNMFVYKPSHVSIGQGLCSSSYSLRQPPIQMLKGYVILINLPTFFF